MDVTDKNLEIPEWGLGGLVDKRILLWQQWCNLNIKDQILLLSITPV